jgi:hypothetical protein
MFVVDAYGKDTSSYVRLWETRFLVIFRAEFCAGVGGAVVFKRRMRSGGFPKLGTSDYNGISVEIKNGDSLLPTGLMLPDFIRGRPYHFSTMKTILSEC